MSMSMTASTTPDFAPDPDTDLDLEVANARSHGAALTTISIQVSDRTVARIAGYIRARDIGDTPETAAARLVEIGLDMLP